MSIRLNTTVLLASSIFSIGNLAAAPPNVSISGAEVSSDYLNDPSANSYLNLFDGDATTCLALELDSVYTTLELTFDDPMNQVFGFCLTHIDSLDPFLLAAQPTSISFQAFNSAMDPIGSSDNMQVQWNDSLQMHIGLNGAYEFGTESYDDVAMLRLNIAGPGGTDRSLAVAGVDMISAAPEPSSAMLGALALSLIGVRRRRAR